MSARSGMAPSETTVTGPPRAAAAASAGASRLAPSVGGSVSNPATRSPNRQMIPPCASARAVSRSEEHTSELQSRFDLVCRLLLEKKKKKKKDTHNDK